jgi:hypothetical protein
VSDGRVWSPNTTRRFWRKWFEWSVAAVCKFETSGHIACPPSLRGPLSFEAGCARSISNDTNTLWSYKRLWICAAWCAIWQHTRLVCKQDILITTLRRPARLTHSRSEPPQGPGFWAAMRSTFEGRRAAPKRDKKTSDQLLGHIFWVAVMGPYGGPPSGPALFGFLLHTNTQSFRYAQLFARSTYIYIYVYIYTHINI